MAFVSFHKKYYLDILYEIESKEPKLLNNYDGLAF